VQRPRRDAGLFFWDSDQRKPSCAWNSGWRRSLLFVLPRSAGDRNPYPHLKDSPLSFDPSSAQPQYSSLWARLQSHNGRSLNHQFLNSLLIPCFWTHPSRKPAFHAGFLAWPKKFPVLFPVIREFPGSYSLWIGLLRDTQFATLSSSFTRSLAAR